MVLNSLSANQHVFRVLFTAWRRGGDDTQRSVARQKSLWNPHGALLSRTLNNQLTQTTNPTAYIYKKFVPEQRRPSTSGQYAPALSNKLHPCNVCLGSRLATASWSFHC